MPATSLSITNKQELGHSITRYWRQNLCGIQVPMKTNRNDLEVGRMFSTYRTTTNTPDFNSPKRPSPLPIRDFYFETKDLVNIGGTTAYKDYIASSSTCGVLYEYTISTGNSAGYRPSLSNYYNYPASPLSADEIARIDHDATTQVLQNVKDMKINLAQFYAEREQAVRMFTENAERLAAAFSALRKGNVVQAAEHLGIPVATKRQRNKILRGSSRKSHGAVASRTAANRWLELQYGWKPLLSDIAGAAEALARAYNGIQRCKAEGKSFRTVDKILLNKTTNDSLGGVTKDWIRVTGRHEIRYMIRFYPDSAMRAPVQLGLTNPLELAWELLPYSFVVDWFADVGKCISNLDATVGLTFDTGCKTEFWKWDYESVGSISGKVGSHDYSYNSGRENLRWIYCKRTRLLSFPSARAPMLKDSSKWLSDLHLANAAALLTTAFFGKSKR